MMRSCAERAGRHAFEAFDLTDSEGIMSALDAGLVLSSDEEWAFWFKRTDGTIQELSYGQLYAELRGKSHSNTHDAATVALVFNEAFNPEGYGLAGDDLEDLLQYPPYDLLARELADAFEVAERSQAALRQERVEDR